MDRKEAIEVVRKKADYYEADKRLKAALEALIPELAESEDEKTLEFMRDHFYNLVKLQDENERMYTKCLVFVTALKGQKAIQDSVVLVAANRPIISKFEAGKAAVLNNPEEYGLCKLAAWSEGDERIRKNICRIVKEHMRHCAEAGIETGDHREALQYLEKQKEQKPVENSISWAELTWKDIVELERIINNVHYDFSAGIGQESFGKEVLERFRSTKGVEYLDEAEQKYWREDEQKEQKPAEWSEEDENQLNWFYRLLDFIGEEFPATWGHNHKGGKEWLKSIHPQHNLRWRRANAGANIPESIIIPDGEEPRFGKCAVKNSYYIPVEELKNLPKDES